MSDRVVVAISGGVDSSVAAALAVEQGRTVIGVTLHLWDAPDGCRVGRCCAPEDRADARRVCDHLGIAHYVLDERPAFRACVVDPFVDEYLAGRTPSPCVHCNRSVKLRRLVDFADRVGASRVRTGHYAKLEARADGQVRLLRGLDRAKDQSYFLFGVRPDVLARIEFPLGDMEKQEVRELGRVRGVPTADKPDSQDLCFVPDGDVGRFVRAQGRTDRPGEIVTETGERIGAHPGIGALTVGQRRGLGLGGGPARYVLRVVPESGHVVVGAESGLYGTRLSVSRASWQRRRPTEPFEAAVRIRYRHAPARAMVIPSETGFDATFFEPQRAITPGQAAVVYDGEEVVGGGFIG